VTRYLYRVCFVLAFVVPWLAFSRSRLQFWASFVTCAVFLASASKIAVGGGNQQAYDVQFPLTLLLAIHFAVRASRTASLRRACMFAAAAGCCMTFMELLRPFGLFVLILLLVYGTALLYRNQRRALLAMLIPVVMFSGVWHLKLFLFNGGQIVWSNHGGHNLYNGWRNLMSNDIEFDMLTPEERLAMSQQEFVGTGVSRRLRLDSELHTVEGRMLGQEVTRFILRHPAASVAHVYEGYTRLFEPKLNIFSMFRGVDVDKLYGEPFRPKGPEIAVYPYFVWTTAAWTAIGLVLLPIAILSRRSLRILVAPESVIIVCAALLSFLIVIGDRGEEARFLFTLLPLLAVYPSILAFPHQRADRRAWALSWRTEAPTEQRAQVAPSADCAPN
jgi:hypothetical protein